LYTNDINVDGGKVAICEDSRIVLYTNDINVDGGKVAICEDSRIVLSADMELHLTVEERTLLKHMRKSYLYSQLPYYDRGKL
jgi:hypothetical protein